MIRQLRFWGCLALVIAGALIAGYFSGHYEGVRSSGRQTQQFLREFVKAADLNSYLEQRGQTEWSGRLAIYGVGGPTSYLRMKGSATTGIMAGLACLGAGLLGLLGFRPGKAGRVARP